MSLIVAIGFNIQAETKVWAVQVNGEPVAVVAEKQAFDQALASLKENFGGELPEERIRIVNTFTCNTARLVSASQLEDELAGALGLRTRACGVRIDGELKLVFADRQTAESFLKQYKAKYPSDPGCDVRFLQKVQLVEVDAANKDIVSIEEAFALAQKLQRQNKVYKVKEGDTLWDIAIASGLTVNELVSANPGLAEDQVLALGQELNVGKTQPLLTVVSTGEVKEIVPVAFPVKVRQDKSLALGSRKVVKPGKEGKKEIVYAVTRYNGKVVKRQQIASAIVQQPVSQEEVRGTRLMVASRGGGHLAWPVSGGGSISQYFGRRHTGLDIAADTGTPVVASEDGQVVDAGWGGGYGRMVVVNHGGGVVTRYAHLSRIAVSAGEQVSRGQVIGYLGSSGNATGPHLHFEIIHEGRFVNPLNYL
ncbi:LysM peptidoglycan-binding domain-containing M23 family metallopeptidase [Desulforudis sp. DRI-14]|uniref:LysM peptidoglycan-binding domain-containing M23 family metallopeptidase n=1 Tax=Desulforudis sp. DRI-14 TaxID=3459793 RepID=UPI0040414CD9